MNKLHELAQLGQSIWYDNISRAMLDSGEMQTLIDSGVRGVTSNPSIFEKAIAKSEDYDALIQKAPGDATVEQVYEGLAMNDIARAADMLLPVYQETNKLDGYISLEVSPALANDTEGTINMARRFWNTLNKPNLMIKVPATPEGIPAIRQLIEGGINVNVTLLFAVSAYEAVAHAFIEGLEARAAAGKPIDGVASVASFFISRVDSEVDKRLEAAGNNDLQGKIGIANAKVAYQSFLDIFSGDRWDALSSKGAAVQRPLWASTSTKNPAYPDTLYVDTLIGKHTVNTAPPATLDAFVDRGTVAETLVDLDQAAATMSALAEAGVDIDEVTQQLLDEGVEKFAKAFDGLLASVKEKRAKLVDPTAFVSDIVSSD